MSPETEHAPQQPAPAAGPDGDPAVDGAANAGVPIVKATERPHPLTPFIRGWIVLVAILLGFGRELIPGGQGDEVRLPALQWLLLIIFGIVLLAAAAGFVSWYFTRFVIDDEELRIETGALNRNSKRISFERLQSIDVIQPFAARIFGLAELRLEVGAGDSTVKLRYLSRDKATRLRDYLLARAHGEQASIAESEGRPAASAFTDAAVGDRIIVRLDPIRLVLGFLLSSDWLLTVLIVLVGFIVTAVFNVALFALPALFPLAIGALTMIGRRVIAQFNFTLAETGRGLRITRGLTNLTSQSVLVDRIQGIRLHQPLLWKPLGWYRVDVDILGLAGNDNNDNRGEASSILLPVADAGQLRLALERILPGVDLAAIPLHAVPRRVKWIRPFDWWTLRYGWDSKVMVTEHGWLTRIRNIVPHAKTQSVRIERGPLQRVLRLASVHVDTTKGPVTMEAPHLEPQVARELALSQLDRARVARAVAAQPTSTRSPRTSTGSINDEDQLLAQFGIAGAKLLGSGGEARVFALSSPDDTADAAGGTQVFRLYHSTHEAASTITGQLAKLYDSWSGADIGVQTPQIMECGEVAGHRYTIDRRMSGQDFSGWLRRAPADARRQALLSYLQVAASLQRLPLPKPGFARLLGEAPQQFDTLADLYHSQLQHGVSMGGAATTWQQLSHDLPDVHATLDRLQADLGQRQCEPALVHGDLCPANAFLTMTPAGPRVTGVGDFSPHTLAADPMLDITGAVCFLELESYPGSSNDARWLAGVVTERFGDDALHWMDVYRRYYAFYFSDDPAVYPWSVAQLSAS